METFCEQLSFFFGWVLRSTAQISVLVCLILIIKAVLQNRLQARWHYCLWIVLLVRMLMPWAPESRMSVFNLIPDLKFETKRQNDINKDVLPVAYIDTDTIAAMPAAVPEIMEAGPKIEGHSKPTERLVLGAAEMLSLVWFGGAFVLGVYVLAGNFSLWRIVRRQRPLTEQKVLDLLEDCKQQMGVQTVLGVVVTDRIKSPALFGFVRPRLLLPAGIIESLRDEELRNVFLHELAHLKRHDIGFGWLMAVCQVIHWFNPLVWYGFHRMRIDRELACDALALSRGQADKYCEYGRTIVHLLEKFSQPQRLPGLACILEDKSQLKRRITMIARFKKGSYRWSVLAVVLLTVLSCVVLTNARGATQVENKEPKTLAKEFVQLLVEEDFSKAAQNFDATMKAALPEDKLAEVWKATTGQAGLFKQQLGVREEKFLGSDIVLVTCEFEKGPMDVKVVYNDEKQIGGLFFVPTPQDVLESYQQQPAEEEKAKFQRRDRTSRSTRRSAPQVISTTPIAFSKDVSPDLKQITVTFDQPMMNLSWSWVGGGETYPETTGRPRYDSKKLTCTLPVKLEAGKFYWVGINSPQFTNFQTEKGVPAVPYVILFATKDKDGNPTDIPENFIEDAEEINTQSKQKELHPAANSTRGPSRVRGKMVKLSVDDGSSDGRKSIAGSGHAVMFDAPGEGCILKSVFIYGSRYGYPQPPQEDFHIWLCDEEFNVIEDFPFPYSSFTRENPKWVTFRVKSIEVPSTFVICAGFNPEQTKGVYVHYDNSSSGNSFTGLPGEEMAVFNDGEWMIRAVIQEAGVESKLPVKSQSEREQGPLGKWESVDLVQKVEDFKAGEKSWGSDLFLEGIEFKKGGKTSNPMMPGWENEWILHRDGQTKARYIIKEIDGTSYLFLPWLSGDVTERGQKPWYYVLKKPSEGAATRTDKLASENLSAEGWNLWGQRKLAEAETKFKEAIEKDPMNEDAYQGLGWAQLNQGKRLNAEDSFKKCVRLNPQNAAALNGLGWIAHGQRKTNEAIRYWETAVEASPFATAALGGLTQTYMELQKYDEAVKYYQMWLKVEPDNTQAKESLEKAQAAIKNR